MLPYQLHSDALLPDPAAADCPDRSGLVFPFFSDFPLAFAEFSFGFGDGLGEAFATRVFLGVGCNIGFGVSFGFGVGVAVGLGVDAAVGAGFGVGDANSISLFAVTTDLCSCASSSFDRFGSSGGLACLAGDDGSFADSPAGRSPAPPNQTMLSGFDEALAAKLQRIRPAISAMCTTAIRITFRQKRPLATP